ncbi:MAG: hypothetical protein GY749_15750 [Desulfobacteraceae bacterium]|nr:hypothetical protein [Desulfobacteraceae bacterium]
MKCFQMKRRGKSSLVAKAGIMFIAMMLAIPGLTWTQDIPIQRFKIGGIPSQIAWHGTTLKFEVYSDIPDAVFSQDINGSPIGTVDFNDSTGLFTYTPDAADNEQFFVEFTGSESEYQKVEINPTPHLPPEQTVFGIDPKTYPDAEYMDYVVRNEVKSETAESFNNVTRHTRSVSISGKTLVFQKDFAKNTLYNDYNDNEDITEFKLFAETVIIRSPLNLPQTNVTIHARELRFEDSGGEEACIRTTPKSIEIRPVQFEDGAHGLKAGNITLYIESFHSDSGYDTRFVLDGGEGQAAGLGKDGADGTSMPVVSGTDVVWYDYKKEKCFACISLDWENRSKGTKAWPGDGENAVPGGKPGNSGDGGVFSSNVENLASYASQNGGGAGEKAPDYQGGAAGAPVNSKWRKRRNYCCRSDSDDITATHTSKEGNDAASPSADILVGNAGTISSVGSTMTWFSPFTLKAIVAHAKDAYLQGHLVEIQGQEHDHREVREILEDYIAQVETYKNSDEWANLTDTEQYEFLQLKGEMEILLHRIYTNLDYFCNPAGWTPMLSFEVTMSMFENEIDRAIRVLYLTYWLGNKASDLQAKLSGLATAHEKLKDEIQYFQTRYSQVTEEVIPKLQTDAENIVNQISYLQSELRILEQKLSAEAEANTKGDMWRQTAGILGTICTFCPIGQPVVGAIGQGLNIISNYDQDKPLETVEALWNLSGEFSDGKFLETVKQFDEDVKGAVKYIKETIEPGKIESYNDLETYVKSLQNIGKPMEDKLNIIRTEIEGKKVPKSEIEAELQRLKANSPEYRELIDKISNLMLEKEQFAQQLANAMQETMNRSNGIIHNMLAIDGLKHDMTEGNAAIDQRAVVYLKEMENRAKERLLRYHYYVMKAYEYRMLEGYTGELNLNSMFEKFKTLASSDGNLSQSDFDALKALYEEQLSTVIDTIYKKYVANPPAKSALIRFELDQKRLDELNNDKTTILNLADMGIFQSSEENIRIVSFNVYDIEAEIKKRSFCRLDLSMTHSGISKLAKNGQIYLFRHYNNDTEHPIEWQVNYDCKYDEIDVVKPPLADISLLKYLMGKKGIETSDDNVVLFSRPSAWADITVTKLINTDEGSDVIVKKLVFEVQYDFVKKPTDIRKLEVKVSENGAMPYFALGLPDKNSRQDGIGEFQRTYTANRAVTVTAPEQYGSLTFDKWTDQNGNELGTDNVLEVTLNDDKSIEAQYGKELSYSWHKGDWDVCDNDCMQTRIVECRDNNNNAVADSYCSDAKPDAAQICFDYSGCDSVEAVQLTLDDVGASPGSTDVPLVVSLNNSDQDIASVQFRIQYDSNSGIHASGKYELTSRTEGFSCSVMPMESGTGSAAKVLLYNMSGDAITLGTGQIIKIFFNVDEDAALPATLSFEECIVSDESGVSILTDYTDAAVISQTANGDMNGDGSINILDLQLLINCILGKADCDGGDLNGDGKSNILDLQKLINKIVNPSNARKRSGFRRSSDSVNILTLPYFQLQQNQADIFELNLTNENMIAAMQISFTYDSTIGLNITDKVTLTPRTADFEEPVFQSDDSDPENVEVSVLLYSMSGAVISPGNGSILEFSYETSDDVSGTTMLRFDESILSDEDAVTLQIEAVSGKISSEMGDIDYSRTVDLEDAVAALKILSGMNAPNIYADTDINGDEKVGNEELVFILQVVADIR